MKIRDCRKCGPQGLKYLQPRLDWEATMLGSWYVCPRCGRRGPAMKDASAAARSWNARNGTAGLAKVERKG